MCERNGRFSDPPFLHLVVHRLFGSGVLEDDDGGVEQGETLDRFVSSKQLRSLTDSLCQAIHGIVHAILIHFGKTIYSHAPFWHRYTGRSSLLYPLTYDLFLKTCIPETNDSLS